MLERIITQPQYAERAHIFLHNLSVGMDETGAIRNSFAEDPKKFNEEVVQFFAAGNFAETKAPNRPLNPDRDFHTTYLTSDEGDLMRADLLMPDSRAIYQRLLASGNHAAEANEGLAILAMRAGDVNQARTYIDAARKAGTKNAVALTEYATRLPSRLGDQPCRPLLPSSLHAFGSNSTCSAPCSPVFQYAIRFSLSACLRS